MYLFALFTMFCPLAAAIGSILLFKNSPWLYRFNVAAAVLSLSAVGWLWLQGPLPLSWDNWLYVDALSLIFSLLVASLGLSALAVSGPYLAAEIAGGHLQPRRLGQYYALLQLFIFTMQSALFLENLGFVWVAIEATTLASTLLVAFQSNRSSLEAAWKYVLLCTVGISLAMLGAILLYQAQATAGVALDQPLSLVALSQPGVLLDAPLSRLAFAFLLIGYATKAGLAPMHTWLPDAHSQAPAPVSGLLSGALLSCAFYVLLRHIAILRPSLPPGLPETALLALGILSLAVAVPFLLLQHDLKRLLAYSSVEHMGILAIGAGVGTPAALFACLLHVLTHGFTKSALFYAAGFITQEYHSRQLSRIRGLLQTSPFLGWIFLAAMLSITGTPPFSVFLSKFLLLQALFAADRPWLAALLLLLLAGAFAGLMHYAGQLTGGTAPHSHHSVPLNHLTRFILVGSLLLVAIGGLFLPDMLVQLLNDATLIALGGAPYAKP